MELALVGVALLILGIVLPIVRVIRRKASTAAAVIVLEIASLLLFATLVLAPLGFVTFVTGAILSFLGNQDSQEFALGQQDESATAGQKMTSHDLMQLEIEFTEGTITHDEYLDAKKMLEARSKLPN